MITKGERNTHILQFSIVTLCAFYFILQQLNHRSEMADFRVYYDAATAIRKGTQLYGEAFGVSSGFYKYSPLAATLFIPFSLLPYKISSGIFFGLITLCIVAFSRMAARLIVESGYSKNAFIAAVIALVFVADHLERELHLGNVNLLLLTGCAFVKQFAQQGKPFAAAALYALVLSFKPHFIILIPVLWFWGYRKTLLYTATMLPLAMMLPISVVGIEQNFLLHSQWIQAMRDHNTALYMSPNTIYGILHTAIPWKISGVFYILAGLTLSAILTLRLYRNTGNSENPERFGFFFYLALAMIPSLAHTDTEHFMWTWPLIAYIWLHYLSNSAYRNVLTLGLLIVAFLPYTLNSPDIVGDKLRYIFDEGGLLGAANVIILCLACFIFAKQSGFYRNAVKAT